MLTDFAERKAWFVRFNRIDKNYQLIVQRLQAGETAQALQLATAARSYVGACVESFENDEPLSIVKRCVAIVKVLFSRTRGARKKAEQQMAEREAHA